MTRSLDSRGASTVSALSIKFVVPSTRLKFVERSFDMEQLTALAPWVVFDQVKFCTKLFGRYLWVSKAFLTVTGPLLRCAETHRVHVQVPSSKFSPFFVCYLVKNLIAFLCVFNCYHETPQCVGRSDGRPWLIYIQELTGCVVAGSKFAEQHITLQLTAEPTMAATASMMAATANNELVVTGPSGYNAINSAVFSDVPKRVSVRIKTP